VRRTLVRQTFDEKVAISTADNRGFVCCVQVGRQRTGEKIPDLQANFRDHHNYGLGAACCLYPVFSLLALHNYFQVIHRPLTIMRGVTLDVGALIF